MFVINPQTDAEDQPKAELMPFRQLRHHVSEEAINVLALRISVGLLF